MPSDRRTTLGPINTAGGGRRMSMGHSGASDVTKINHPQKQQGTRKSRKSMIPSIGGGAGSTNPSTHKNSSNIGSNNNKSSSTTTSSSSSSRNNRRQSIAVMPQHSTSTNSRESMTARSSSVAPRGVVEDPRPITDKVYMKRSTTVLYKYLMENGYENPITMKSLHLPSAKDFSQIVTFLLRRFDPSFNDSNSTSQSYGNSNNNNSSNSLKFEDEVTMAFKALGYPFPISKTGLVAAGSPHTWPALLAALTWLVELLQYDEVREQEMELKKVERANGISGGDEIEEGNGIDMEKMVDKSEKAFFDYLLNAYEMFLCGDDERHDELEEGLVELFEEDNATLEREKNKVMDSTVSILEAIEALRTKGDGLPELEKRRENYCDDLEKFRELVKQLVEHKATLERKVAERENELLIIGKDLQLSKQKVSRLKEIISTQEITTNDVKKMDSERAELDDTIEKLSAEKMSFNKQIWENEMELSRRFEQISALVHDFNNNAKRLGLIPADAINANGTDFSLKLKRCLVFNGSKNIFEGRVIEGILSDLIAVKDDLLKREASCKDKMMGILDLEDASEALLVEKNDEIKSLDVKIKKSDETLNRETEDLHNTLAAIEQETEAVEEKIVSVRDPVALESTLIKYRNDLTAIETLRQQQEEGFLATKKNVISEICQSIDAMTNYKQYKDGCFVQLGEIIGDTEGSIEVIDATIVDELENK